jgi:hypothetical protein
MSSDLRNDVIELARALAKPIDFEALERRGALKKRTKYWYQVVDQKQLPDYIWKQATELRFEGSSVSIKLPVTWKRAQQTLESIERELA